MRGQSSTLEVAAERTRKLKANAGRYERTPEIREKTAAAKRGKPMLSTRGEKHHGWKGGRKADGNGYIVVLVDGQYKKEHRVVMERELGRPLVRGEEIHHINAKRDDNRVENLLVVMRSEHRLLEGSLMRAAYEAMKLGAIEFADGEYRLAAHHCRTCTCSTVQIVQS